MSAPLPHPNITPPPGAHLDSAALGAIFDEIQRNFDALSLAQGESAATRWATPAFIGTTNHYEVNGAFAMVAYRKGRDGRVQLRGVMKTTSSFAIGFAFFNLPAGFRPPQVEIFSCFGGVDGAAGTALRLDVHPNGNVIALFPATKQLDFVSLSQIGFYAA